MNVAGHELRPWVLGMEAAGYAHRGGVRDALCFDPLDPADQDFAGLVRAGNRVAYGADLAMPAWVQLDLCTLPSAMLGFAVRRSGVSGDLWSQIGPDLPDYDGWVPVSEYCAVPRLNDTEILGVSLYVLLRGIGLGVRTKALALSCYAASEQLGITQFDSPSLRIHTAFGALQILRVGIPGHERGARSFLYRLHLPPLAELWEMRESGRPAPEPPADALALEIGNDIADRVQDALRERETLTIVAPGLHRDGDRRFLICR